MIKKWNEYIKESIKELSTTKADIEKLANKLLEDHINDIFVELHQEFKTESGDISPGEVFELERLQRAIAKIMVNQVFENMGSDLTKVRASDLDIDALKNLSDEKNELKEGDDVLLVYYDGGYSIYRCTLQKISETKLGYRQQVSASQHTTYELDDTHLAVKVETYNDFCDIDKRIPD